MSCRHPQATLVEFQKRVFFVAPEENGADKVSMKERRTGKRLLCADLVDVCWHDEAGRLQKEVMVLEDISLSGVCLQSETPHAEGAEVTIQYGGGAIPGVIRYCVYQDIGYFVGIEFTENFEWPKDKFRPKHLFDPDTLLKRPAPGRDFDQV